MSAEPETDAEREQAYKRGYAHGVAASISAFSNIMSRDESEKLDVWYKKVLVPWMVDSGPRLRAPDFPAL